MSLAGAREMVEMEPLADCRVVVLCAEPRLRQLLSYWLSAATPDLTVAGNGRQAATLLADPRRSTVLITDRVVPPWPGLPPLPALKLANPHLRVVVVDERSGAPGHAPGATAGGADDTLPRPLSRAAVLRSIAAPF